MWSPQDDDDDDDDVFAFLEQSKRRRFSETLLEELVPVKKEPGTFEFFDVDEEETPEFPFPVKKEEEEEDFPEFLFSVKKEEEEDFPEFLFSVKKEEEEEEDEFYDPEFLFSIDLVKGELPPKPVVTFPVPVRFRASFHPRVVEWLNREFSQPHHRAMAVCMLRRWVFLFPNVYLWDPYYEYTEALEIGEVSDMIHRLERNAATAMIGTPSLLFSNALSGLSTVTAKEFEINMPSRRNLARVLDKAWDVNPAIWELENSEPVSERLREIMRMENQKEKNKSTTWFYRVFQQHKPPIFFTFKKGERFPFWEATRPMVSNLLLFPDELKKYSDRVERVGNATKVSEEDCAEPLKPTSISR